MTNNYENSSYVSVRLCGMNMYVLIVLPDDKSLIVIENGRRKAI